MSLDIVEQPREDSHLFQENMNGQLNKIQESVYNKEREFIKDRNTKEIPNGNYYGNEKKKTVSLKNSSAETPNIGIIMQKVEYHEDNNK